MPQTRKPDAERIRDWPQLGARVNPDLYRRLVRLAEERGCSLREVVGHILSDALTADLTDMEARD